MKMIASKAKKSQPTLTFGKKIFANILKSTFKKNCTLKTHLHGQLKEFDSSAWCNRHFSKCEYFDQP